MLLAAAASPLGAAELELLADLNSAGLPGAGFDSFEEPTAVLDDRYFLFGANDGVTGSEPWSLDLTTGEVTRLADIASGTAGSRPEQFTALGSVALFVATSLEHGEELWRTDGTPAGTLLVEDIRPGPESSGILELFRISPTRAVFRADDGLLGAEPWVTNGTAGGTAPIADVRPGVDASSPGSFAIAGGQLYFRANDGTNGAELWRWNGINTFLVADIEPGAGSSSPTYLYAVGTKVVFRATRAADGAEPWQSDGSVAGTTPIADLNPAGHSNPYNFYYHPGLARLFFTADDGVHGLELFQLALGIVTRLTDINPGSEDSNPKGFGETPTRLTFTADDGGAGTRLYSYDGAGVTFVKALSTAGVPNYPEFVTSWNGQVYLKAGSCWRTDGTLAGTDDFSSCSSSPAFAVGDGRLVFGVSSFGVRELYSIDAADVVVQETDLPSYSSEPEDFFWFGDRLLFAADDGENGRELWVWNRASAAAPVRIDIDPGPGSSSPRRFVAFAGQVWFAATSAATGNELWRTDGTAAGTAVYELDPGASGSYPNALAVVGETLFVSADNDGGLYRIVSSALPPELLEVDGDTSLYAEDLVANGGELAFTAWTTATGDELFTIGEADAEPVAHELLAGPDDGYLADGGLVPWGGALYFLADDDGFDPEVWKYAGGALSAVSELGPGASPDEIAAGPDGVYLAAYGDAIGRELFRTQGVDTVAISDIAPGEDDAWPGYLTLSGDRLYFRASDDTAGYELWWTDGADVERLADLFPGTSGSNPQNLVPVRERLLFTADDGEAGEEIFVTTDASATRLPEVLPGPATATPRFLTASPDGCIVVFSAAHPELGREPYRVQRCLFLDGFESGGIDAWNGGPPA